MVVLDTNIIIDHLRQHPKTKSRLDIINKEVSKEDLALSVVSIQELYIGQSTKVKSAENLVVATVVPLKILPYTYEVAELAGKLSRDSKGLMQFADAAIAATAIVNGCQLYTLNKKDFLEIPELEFFE